MDGREFIGPALLPGEEIQPIRFGRPPALDPAQGWLPWQLRDAEDRLHLMGWASPSLEGLVAPDSPVSWRDLAGWSARLRLALNGHPSFGWRDEQQRLVGSDGQLLWGGDGQPLGLERSLFRPLGLMAQSVQLNLLHPSGRQWVGRRSLKKAIDPGLWDAPVAGGLPSHETPSDALVREAWEEAGVTAEMARCANFRGPIRVARRLPDQVHVERLWVYSLEVGEGWQPSPQDDEVTAFECWTSNEIVARWSEGQFNHEAAVGLLALS